VFIVKYLYFYVYSEKHQHQYWVTVRYKHVGSIYDCVNFLLRKKTK